MPQSVGRKLTTSRERTVRIREVDGSIPFGSTKIKIAAVFAAAIFLFHRRNAVDRFPFTPQRASIDSGRNAAAKIAMPQGPAKILQRKIYHRVGGRR